MNIVTLTTDYGQDDYYVALLKGAISLRTTDVQYIDISHNIKAYDIVQGAFYLQNVMSKFPAKSIHIASVQSYSSYNDAIIVFEYHNQYFIGPNNGLFSLVLPNQNDLVIYQINVDRQEYPFVEDVYAHAVASINHGLPLSDIGTTTEDFIIKIGIQPVKTSSQIRATIIHVDRFGNVIVNLKKETFEVIRKKRRFKLFYKSKDPITHISKHYGSVSIGDVMCFFNSSEYLEIAINMGNAHELLSLRKHETVQIDFYE